MEAKELTALIAYLNVCPKIKGGVRNDSKILFQQLSKWQCDIY